MRHKNLTITVVSLGLASLLTVPSAAIAGARAKLDGYQENPSISTDATGRFRTKLKRWENAIEFRLSYSNIESPVRFAHIHLAQRHVNGGIVVWLCNNTGNSPIAVDPCPQGGGSVEGVITPASITGADAQGLAPGEFDELLDAIDRRATYVNVHSDAFPGGEIRGQIRWNSHGHNDHD
jgi:hypothetical protein